MGVCVMRVWWSLERPIGHRWLCSTQLIGDRDTQIPIYTLDFQKILKALTKNWVELHHWPTNESLVDQTSGGKRVERWIGV